MSQKHEAMKLLPDNSSNLNELLFENRNKQYGAYALRKEQDKRTLWGFLFACSLFVIAAGGMKFFNNQVQPKGPVIMVNDDRDSLIVVTFDNTLDLIKDTKIKVETSKVVKTDPGNNYVAATKDADSIRTIADLKKIIMGPKNDDTTGTGSIGKGKIVIKLPEQPDTTTYDGNTVAIMPQFDGDFLSYLRKNTIYPQIAKENGIEGVVHMNFIIDKEGNVSSVKILNPKANDLLKKESMRVFSNIPKWKPASDGKRNVRVSMTVPMRFSLK